MKLYTSYTVGFRGKSVGYRGKSVVYRETVYTVGYRGKSVGYRGIPWEVGGIHTMKPYTRWDSAASLWDTVGRRWHTVKPYTAWDTAGSLWDTVGYRGIPWEVGGIP